jgi:rRNA-processing protein FCF1
MITTQQAVMSLRPGVEWTMNGEDIENIIWHTPNIEPLTTKQVKAEIKRLEKEEKDKEAAEAAAREAAIAHAKTLGFTDEMIAVMYPNLGEQL